ncbi:ribonuclease 1-like isoform X2 [Amborella trichopoda]|uniref:ribonuclease 1-like isoform X2 n=1 Tax=Amborella trichopoda TaxID=13333 RepID=UPI0009C0BD0F|nr:ribonuclease 1-like isoform X2 [Amborella trichopoda]|eukprot:XP_020523985.1 ribonuclease 1-like isoform X2 [Amborella trichopoda]
MAHEQWLLLALVGLGMGLQAMAEDFNFYYYVSQLEGLEESLSGLWSSIKCPSNNGQSMWKSLWKNNGVCSILSLFKYFKQGIIIHCEINLIKALRFQGIVPDGRLYQLTDIKQALKEEIGEEVGIRCSTNLEGEFQLYEVYVCIDKSFATGVIPCPTLPYFTCSDEILFPAFNVQMLKKNGTRNSLELQVE